LSTIYTREGIRGLYKGSLLALVGVSNGSIQFATYEAIKRQRADIKRRLYEKQGREWKIEDEKLVSLRAVTGQMDGPCSPGERRDGTCLIEQSREQATDIADAS
jgi:solute carrier family 25 folate transporter 32